MKKIKWDKILVDKLKSSNEFLEMYIEDSINKFKENGDIIALLDDLKYVIKAKGGVSYISKINRSNKIMKKTILDIGDIWSMESNGNPFKQKLYASKILNIQGGYVQYVFLRDDGKTTYSWLQSEKIKDYKRIYPILISKETKKIMKVFINPKENAYENKEISDFLKPKPKLLPRFIYNWLIKNLTHLQIQRRY